MPKPLGNRLRSLLANLALGLPRVRRLQTQTRSEKEEKIREREATCMAEYITIESEVPRAREGLRKPF